MIRFIGDSHGKIDGYLSAINGSDRSIQVGDFGMGFSEMPVIPGHRFIRGNHDDPEKCRSNPNWIEDGTMENGMFFLGGAFSVDHTERELGVDFWKDEQLTDSEFDNFLVNYSQYQPDIMVTHDIPESVARELFPHLPTKERTKSRTRIQLDFYFLVHQPKYWIFGHWHESVRRVINGTRFICLNELETYDLNL